METVRQKKSYLSQVILYRLNQYIVNIDALAPSPCRDDIGRKQEEHLGGATPHSPVSRASSTSDSAKITENSVNGSGRRPQSPDSAKMTGSSASEADSAMSQVLRTEDF